MRIIKLITINLAILVVLLLVGNLALGVFFEFRDRQAQSLKDARSELPHLVEFDWAPKHFEEFNGLETDYQAYYGWRRRPFTGETITVMSNGLRSTPSAGDKLRIGFFGGSTMWGTGARDQDTIPAIVAAQLEAESVNYGETGWRAHQSLNQLMEAYIAGERFDVVVFYDGVNEVALGCRAELAPFSHVREGQIAARLTADGKTGVLEGVFAPSLRFAATLQRKIAGNKNAGTAPFDCSTKPEKARFLARMLEADWDVAAFVAERMGAQFIGVLQPVIFSGSSPREHLKLNDALEAEYEAVYPHFREALTGFDQVDGRQFIDLSAALDSAEAVYIDWAHLTPTGNGIIAEKLAGGIAQVTAQATGD